MIKRISIILQIFLIVGTVLLFGVLTLKTTGNKKEKLKNMFKGINNCYINYFKYSKLFEKFLMVISCFLVGGGTFLISLQECCFREKNTLSAGSFVLSIVCWGILSFFIYFIFGILFVQVSKIVDNISLVKDRTVSNKLLISFVLLFLLLVFSFVFENAMRKCQTVLLIGATICYILNIQILLKFVYSPIDLIENVKEKDSENKGIIIFNSVLVLMMFIANLYLFVLWSFFSCENAYVYNIQDPPVITKWHLLYYTFISFTTIGFGDIVPKVISSQLVGCIISVTSVICLVVFVNSILSEIRK